MYMHAVMRTSQLEVFSTRSGPWRFVGFPLTNHIPEMGRRTGTIIGLIVIRKLFVGKLGSC